MTDPDERIINRAIVLLHGDENMTLRREEARAALHRLFRDRRRLERENERLRATDSPIKISYLEAEVERLRKLTDYLRAGEVDIDEQERQFNELRAEVERLRAWQDEVVRGYEFKDADEMLAWVRHIWEEE